VSRYPSRRYYERISGASGYPPGPLETVYRLADLLNRIEAALPEELLLRGGTALNLLHLDAPRLSVDLDLDYVASPGAEAARARRPQLLAEIEGVAARAGYAVEHLRPSYAMAHLVLRYDDAAGRPAGLKLDLNFLDRLPVVAPLRLPLQHPFGPDLEAPEVLTFALEELAASKTIALARRGLARDLFDVAELAGLEQLDHDLVRTVLTVRGAAYPPPSPAEYAPDAGRRVRLVDWRSQVVALALRGRDLDLGAAQTRAEGLLQELFALTDGQREFLRALEAGTLDAGLLGAPALEARVAANPGLLWRLWRGSAELEER
jgi:predicted nucleotidyltransferase component of viral defense system